MKSLMIIHGKKNPKQFSKNPWNSTGVLPIEDIPRLMVREDLKNSSEVLPIEDILRLMVRENRKNSSEVLPIGDI